MPQMRASLPMLGAQVDEARIRGDGKRLALQPKE
jgi:hypothetical protein